MKPQFYSIRITVNYVNGNNESMDVQPDTAEGCGECVFTRLEEANLDKNVSSITFIMVKA